MDKLTMAHDYLLKIMSNSPLVDQADIEFAVSTAWSYARMMHSEKINEDKAEAEQKRKEVREMLNAPNTFVEREGEHFDDVEEWQPDWSQAPEGFDWWAQDKWGSYWYDQEPKWIRDEWGGYIMSKNNRSATEKAPSFNYQGNWQDSLRERPQ